MVWRGSDSTCHESAVSSRHEHTDDPTGLQQWPDYNRRLRDVIAALTEEQLAIRPSPERWPMWATIGHAACQRVFWLCDFAGEPGAASTRFTNAGYDCPGDDDLEHVLSAGELVEALESTFRIVDGCLDRWTLDMLSEELRRPEWDGSWVHTRGAVIQRVFSHDVYHVAELNETLGVAGLSRAERDAVESEAASLPLPGLQGRIVVRWGEGGN